MSAPFDLRESPLGPGTVLLEASAGTGKTYTLVGILLRLLLERRIARLDQALVVTFTVAATAELKNRLRLALQETLRAVHEPVKDAFLRDLAQLPGAEAVLQQALAAYDQVGIATIHGFCKRLLEEAAFESGQPFELEFTADPLPLLHRAAADALRNQYEPGTTVRSALLQLGGHTPDALVEAYRLWRRHPDVRLDPSPPDLETHLARAERALPAIVAACDAPAMERIASIEWKGKDRPFAGDAAEERRRFHERLRSQPALVLDTLLALAPASYEARVHMTKTRRTVYEHPFFTACGELEAACRLAGPHLRSHLLLAMHDRVERGKDSEHVLTFDDLLIRADAALQDPERRPVLLQALRARFEVALIDEFQDTDSLQYRVFADLFAGRTLFLIGDPKQAIYGFRGAELRTYLEAKAHAVQEWSLPENHRSSRAMVTALGHLWGAHPCAFVGDLRAEPVRAAAPAGALAITGDGHAALRWRFVPMLDGPKPFRNKPDAEACIVADVAAEACRLLTGGARIDGAPVRARDLAILTRTNAQAMAVQGALRAVGVPSAIGKAGDIFATDELGELQRFLHAVLQPGDLRRVRTAMATRLWGFDAAALAALEADDAAFDRQLERLAFWRRLWLRSGYIVMQEQVLVDLDVHARFLSWHDGERRLTNFRQLFELLHAAEHTHRLSPEGLLQWLHHERTNQDDLDYTLRELRLESDEDAAQILTVHGSKGLQYEIVFCPFLWDAKGPRKAVDVATTKTGHELAFALDTADPRHAQLQRERFEEDLRLAYVAMTRAKRRCYVHWGGVAQAAASSAPTWLLLARSEHARPADSPQAADELTKWFARAKAETSRWREKLAELAAASEGTIDVTDVPPSASTERVPAKEPQVLRPPLRLGRHVSARALHSFSSLVAHAPGHEAAPERRDADRPPSAAPGAARGVFAFARGPAAGQCLHTILERVDLANAHSAATAEVIRDVLLAAGLADPSAHDGELEPVADVQRALGELAAATVFPGGPTIAQLASGRRQVEWQFALPTAEADVQTLAAIFADSASTAARSQAERLRALGPQTLRGFLIGFVDLVAEHDGRYWVLDWKSNHLGNDAADYAPDRLATVMSEHDYVLQYHLYVLALHRHLRARLPGYDPERDLGGVAYAFLRGAVPGSSCGMFHDRVPGTLVAAMDEWASGTTRSTR